MSLSPVARRGRSAHRSSSRSASPKQVKPFERFRPGLEELESRLAPTVNFQSIDPTNFANGIDTTLASIHNALQSAVNTVGDLPLVGSKFDSAVQPLINDVDTARTQFDTLVSNVMTAVHNNPATAAINYIQSGLFQIFGPSGLGVLLHDNPNGTSTASNSQSDVLVTQGADNCCGQPVAGTDWAQWDMHLGQTYTLNLPFDLGVSLPSALSSLGFSLGANGGLQLQFSWNLHLGFGVSMSQGFYAVTGSNAPVTPAYSGPDLNFTASVSATAAGLSANASFGDLVVHVSDGTVDPYTNQMDYTGLQIVGSVGLVSPSYNTAAFDPNLQETYDRLTYTEMSEASDPKSLFRVDVTATGGLHLHATSDPSIVGANSPVLGFIGSALQPPSFAFDFNLTGSAELHQQPITNNFQFDKHLDNMSLDNITMDIHGLLESLAKPLANVTGNLLGPITDIIGNAASGTAGFLDQPLPLVSQLAGSNVTLGSLLGSSATNVIDSVANGIGSIATFAHDISTFLQNYNGQPIPLGNWVFVKLLDEFVPQQAIDALSVALPPLQLPSISLPSIQLPDIQLPDLNIPGIGTVHIPAIHIPAIQLPNLQLPTIDLPMIIMNLPDITLPTIQLPNIQLPNINIGPITLPDGITLNFPSLSLPSLSLPALNLGDITLPSNFQLSDLTLGSLALPSIPLPTIPLPNLELGCLNFTATLPDGTQILEALSIPTLQLPNLSLPSLSLSLPLPNISMPSLSLTPPSIPNLSLSAASGLDILDPSNIVKMFEGKTFNIMHGGPGLGVSGGTANFGASLSLSLGYDGIGINGSVSQNYTITMPQAYWVYDSTGIQEIAAEERAGDTVDWTQLLDGFYVPVPTSGPFMEIGMSMSASASADAGIASAYLTGSLSGDIYLDVLNPTGTNQLRLNDIMALTNNLSDISKILCLFDAGVNFSASLNGGGSLGVSPAAASFSLSDLGLSPTININFSLSSLFPQYFACCTTPTPPPPGPAVLANETTIDGQSVLRLNIGPYAADRVNGNLDDSGGAKITVTGSNGNITVSGYGTSQTFSGNYAYILADGSTGPDQIDCSGVNGVSVHFLGGGGNSTVKTGNDNAYVETGDGNVTVDLGAGNNTVVGGNGNETVNAASGSNNTVDFRSSQSSIYDGGGGNDVVYGSPFGDQLKAGIGPGSVSFFGGGGAGELLQGGSGNNNYLSAGDGNNITVKAGSGNTVLIAGFGAQTLIGGPGNDTLIGGVGTQTLIAGGGDNTLTGGSGNQTLIGGPGNDILKAGIGNQKLYGDGGNDTLYGGVGNDLLDGHDDGSGGGSAGGSVAYYGGLGNNTIVAAFGDKWIDGGTGGTNVLIISGKLAQVTSGVLTANNLQEGAVTTPYLDINSIQVQLGNFANTMTVNGVNLPLSITGGNGNGALGTGDTLTIANLFSPGTVNIHLGTADDTLIVQNTQSVLNVTGGGYFNLGDTLILDFTGNSDSQTGTLNGNTISIKGWADIDYSAFNFVNFNLGGASDTFFINNTAADALTTNFTGTGGADNFYVDNAVTTLGMYDLDTAFTNQPSTVWLMIPGNPINLPNGYFSKVLFNIDRLVVDNATSNGATAAWSYLDGILGVDGNTIIDAGAGDKAAWFDVGQFSANSLSLTDDVPVSQIVSISQPQTTIQEGQDVLSYRTDSDQNFQPVTSTVDMSYLYNRVDEETTSGGWQDGIATPGGPQFFPGSQEIRENISGFYNQDLWLKAGNSWSPSTAGFFDNTHTSPKGGYALDGAFDTGTVSANGHTWNIGANATNDVILASGQTIGLGNVYAYQVDLLAVAGLATGTSSIFGTIPSSFPFVVHYADGSSTTFQQGFAGVADTSLHSGESIALTMSDHEEKDPTFGLLAVAYPGAAHLFDYTFTVDSTKQLTSITLPNDTTKDLNVLGIDVNTAPTPGLVLDSVAVPPGVGSPGSPDVIAALGQTASIPPAYYQSLTFRAFDVNGSGSGNEAFTIHYSDGSQDTFVQAISDWRNPVGYAGETLAYSMNSALQANTGGGPGSWFQRVYGTFDVYSYTFTPNPNKMVVSVTLPNDGADNQVQFLSNITTVTRPAPGADVIDTAGIGNELYTVDSKFSYVSSSTLSGGTITPQSNQHVYGLTPTSQVAVSADGKTVFATIPLNGQVAVFSTTANGSLNGSPTLYNPSASATGAITTANGYVYFASGSTVAGYSYGVGFLGSYIGLFSAGLSNVSGLQALTTSGGTFLYVSSAGNNSVSVFKQNANGTLTLVQTVTNNVGPIVGLGNPGQLVAGTTSTGLDVLYVAGRTQNAIVSFTINATTGMLTYVNTLRQGVQGINGLTGLYGLALTPDGRYLIATGSATNTAVVFGVDPNYGKLTFLQRLRQGSGTTQNLSDPQDIYATNSEVYFSTGGPGIGDGTLSSFDVAPGLPPPRVATIQYTNLDSLTVTNSGGNNIVTVQNVGVPLTVNSNGVGDDVILENTTPNQTTTINLGAGVDTVDVRDTGIGSNVVINGGTNNDTFNVYQTEAGATLIINGGSAANSYMIDGFRLGSAVTVNGTGSQNTLIFNAGTSAANPSNPPLPNGSVAVLGATYGVNYTDIQTIQVFASPVAIITPPASIAEGQGVTLDASGSLVPSGQTVASYLWDINGQGVFGDESGATISLSWSDLYQLGVSHAGTYEVSVMVTLTDGVFDVGSAYLTVTVTPPTLTLTGPSTINGGSVYTLNLSSTTPSSVGVSQWVVNWGDGSPTTTVYGPVTAAQHTYAVVSANTPYTITATASDSEGSWQATLPITVLYVAPTTTSISGNSTATEGQTYTLSLAVSGPNSANLQTWTVYWGDGQTSVVSGTLTTLNHVYANSGLFLIQAIAQWTDGSVTTVPNTVSVDVPFVAPTLSATAGSATTISQGQSFTLHLSATDPNPITQWTVSWGDGSSSVTAGNVANLTHVYRAVGTWSIQVQATDAAGTYPSVGSTLAGPSVTVNEVPPTINVTGAASVSEYATYTLNLSSVGLDGVTGWQITWGDGSTTTLGMNQNQATHVYNAASASTQIHVTGYTVGNPTIGYTVTKTIAVTAVLPAPTISGSPSGVFEGSAYTITLDSGDPGPVPVSSWQINWGDGSGVQTVQAATGNQVSIQLSGSQVFLSIDGAQKLSYDYGATLTGYNSSSTTAGVTVSGLTTTNPGGGATNELDSASIDFGTPGNLGSGYLIFNYVSATDYLFAGVRNLGGERQFVIGHVDATGSHDDTFMTADVTQQVSHVYSLDIGSPFTISATAFQGATSYAAPSMQVTVYDAPLTVAVSGTPQIDSTKAFTLTVGPVQDAVPPTVNQYLINWGDGSATQTFSGVNPAVAGTYTHIFGGGASTHIVQVQAVDSDGAHYVGEVTVVNVGTAWTTDLPPLTGGLAGNTYLVNWGDGNTSTYNSSTPPTNGLIAATHTYGALGVYSAQVYLVDGQGNQTLFSTRSVVISNVAPTITSSPANFSVNEDNPFTLTNAVTVSDPGFSNPAAPTVESFTYSINWGDGSSADTGSMTITQVGSPGVLTLATLSGGHNFFLKPTDTTTSTYTVNVTITDQSGATAAASFQVTVYRPDFVFNSLTSDASNDMVATYTLNNLAPGSSIDQMVLSVYRSTDTTFDASDVLTGTTTITTASELTAGQHTVLLPVDQAGGLTLPGGGAAEVTNDYYLIGQLNPSQAATQPELSYTNNTAVFYGQYFGADTQQVYVEGTGAADDIAISHGSVIVNLNGVSVEHFGTVTGVTIRVHGTNDQIGSTYLAVPLTVYGGGTDRLYLEGDNTQAVTYQPGVGLLGNQITIGSAVSTFDGITSLVFSNLAGLDTVVPTTAQTLQVQNTTIPAGGLITSPQAGQELVVTSGTPFVTPSWFPIGAVTFDLSGGTNQTLSFPDNPPAAQQSLTVLTGSGDQVLFPIAVNWTGGNLTVTGPSTTTFSNPATLGSVSIQGGATQLQGGTVTTTASQSYQGTVQLGADTTLSGSQVTFGGTVDGNNQSLTVNGPVTFNGNVGTTQSLTSLLLQGPATINASQITTSGTQTYQGPVQLSADTTLSGSQVTFNNTVNGSNALTIDGTATFNGDVGTTQALTSLLLQGSTTVNAGQITTSGTQTYQGPVQLATDTTLSGSQVTFDSTVNGNNSLSVNGAATFNGTVGTTQALTNLLVTGSSTLNGSQVTTTGSQSYQGPVQLGVNTTLNGSQVDFGNTVNGAQSLTINGSVIIGGNVGTTQALTTLLVVGPTTVDAGQVTTSGSQTYQGPMQLDANTTLSGSQLTFNGTINGNQSLTLNGSTTFNGNVGTTQALTGLLVVGPTTVNASQLTTSGSQTYQGPVLLDVNATLSGSQVTFNNTVNGNQSLTVNGGATFNGNVGTSQALTGLLVTGPATVTAGEINTNGNQQWQGPLAAQGNFFTNGGSFTAGNTLTAVQNVLVATSGGAITLVGQVFGPGSLTLDAGTGTVTALSPMGASVPLASFSVNGSTVSLVGVNTVGSQVLQGNVLQLSGTFTTQGGAFSLDGTTFLTGSTFVQTHGGTIALNGPLFVGANYLQLNAGGGVIDFNQPVFGLPGGFLFVSASEAFLRSVIEMGRIPGGAGVLEGNVNSVMLQSSNTLAVSNALDIVSPDGSIFPPVSSFTSIVPPVSAGAVPFFAAATSAQDLSGRMTPPVVGPFAEGTFQSAEGGKGLGASSVGLGEDTDETVNELLRLLRRSTGPLGQVGAKSGEMLLDLFKGLRQPAPAKPPVEAPDMESSNPPSLDSFFAGVEYLPQDASAALVSVSSPADDLSGLTMLTALAGLHALRRSEDEEQQRRTGLSGSPERIR